LERYSVGERIQSNSSAQKLYRLSQLAVFKDLSQPALDELQHMAVVHHAGTGHIFYHPQDSGETVYVILEGSVHLYRISPSGKKLIIAVLGPGALFDEASLLGNGVHHNFAQTVTMSVVLAIGRADIKRLMIKHPCLVLRILELAYSRLHRAEAKLESLAFKDMTTRICELLLLLAAEQGSSRITGFTHQDLAEIVGTYRETATQVLNELKSQGYIAIGRKRIDILAPAQLAALSEHPLESAP
jgi:CRP-like cAMP-binding protein